jgi:hypothetical protein
MRAYSPDDVLADKALPLLSRKSSSVSTVRALVLFEDVGARERLEAGFADIGFVASVRPLVRPEIAVLREGLEAGVVDVGRVARARPLVRPEIAVLREGLEAGFADVGFVARVLVSLCLKKESPIQFLLFGSAHFLPVGTAALVFMSVHSIGH